MKWRLGLAASIFALVTSGSSALASSDGGCSLNWTMAHRNLTQCSNMAILNPGNDTRVNLALMLRDRTGAIPTAKPGSALFSWSELGETFYPRQPDEKTSYSTRDYSRCQTVESGKAAFDSALGASRKVTAEERRVLASIRNMMEPDCDSAGASIDESALADVITSAAAKEFETYLRSASAFYEGDFKAATLGFSSLAKASDPWIKETALYMIARSELNRSMAGAFGSYGSFEGVDAIDKAAIANADRGFNLYLKLYGKGQYASSASGLMRRVYWLSGDNRKLADAYAASFDKKEQSDPVRRALIEEIDNKLLPALASKAETDDPQLTAMALLFRMREDGYDNMAGKSLPELTRADIEATQGVFKNDPRLFEYLLAAHAFYVAKRPAEVLQLIPDDARQANFTYLEFSRQTLRGMALEASGDRNARGFWLDVLKGAKLPYQNIAAQLGLAMNYERSNALDKIFADGSPISDETIREILLLNVAGPELLRAQAKNSKVAKRDRDIALFTLMYKNLTRGAYKAFLSDAALVPKNAPNDGLFYSWTRYGEYADMEPSPIPLGIFRETKDKSEFSCPELTATVQTLAANASDIHARLCLTDHLRVAGFDGYWLDSQPDADELGGTPSNFPGKPLSRLEVYKQIIANPKAASDDRAYALYRAVWCYGPSGYNSCGGKDVKKEQRNMWFRELKSQYPSSRWATQLKYYW